MGAGLAWGAPSADRRPIKPHSNHLNIGDCMFRVTEKHQQWSMNVTNSYVFDRSARVLDYFGCCTSHLGAFTNWIRWSELDRWDERGLVANLISELWAWLEEVTTVMKTKFDSFLKDLYSEYNCIANQKSTENTIPTPATKSKAMDGPRWKANVNWVQICEKWKSLHDSEKRGRDSTY
jgi:hypothetical protein